MITLNKHLFLCPPKYLSMDYEINPWMDKRVPFNKSTAQSQWDALVQLYQSIATEHVTLMEPKEHLTELCFFGDSVFAYKNTAVFSRFATDERYPETEYVMSVLNERGFKGERVPEHIQFEGSGETMMWNGNILVGYGRRSSSEIVDYLHSVFGVNIYGFELIDDQYYHLDTAMFPVSDKYIAVYEPAFSDASKTQIKQLDAEILYLSEQDANEFALNSIAIGNHIIVHKDAQNFQEKLRSLGFTVHSHDISEFIKFGGGIKCLTFQHYMA